MAAYDSVPSPDDERATFTDAIKFRAASWFLERKLYRRTRADFADAAFQVIAIRLYSAAACFISMLLVAWLGSFARAVSAHDWRVFRTLDGTTLLAASMQAARDQSYLLPVFLWWAALLLFTPRGYTVAFRAAVVAAGILGYVNLSPPAFLVTRRVTGISHWLIRFEGRASIPYLIISISVAYVLLSSAASTFRRLDHLRKKPGHVSRGESDSLDLIREVCAIALALLVLLSVVWAATVVRLAVSHASSRGPGMSYGYQGGLYQSKYLLVLALIAVCLPMIYDIEKWLVAAVALTALYGLAPNALIFPSILEIPAGRGQLTHIGAAWGNNSLWAALIIYIPAAILGIHLAARLLRSA